MLPDLRWGVGYALGVATLFSMWVLVLALLRGSARFDKYGMTAWQIVATYYAVALVGGAVLGLVRPLTASRPGATAVGALVGTLIYTGVGISMDGGFSTSTLVMGLIAGVPVGGIVAYRFSSNA